MRYVLRTSSVQPSTISISSDPLVLDNGGVSIPSNLRVPPSFENHPIIVKLPSGKNMKIITRKK